MDESSDPAAVFACAKSLHDACLERADAEPDLNLSEAYQGMDNLMREVMRAGGMFEDWACRHVVFHELEDVWPYLLENRFGAACLEIMDATSLAGFDEDDCLRIALRLHLPIQTNGTLPLPICVEARNPHPNAEFRRLRIQTMRRELADDGEMVPFTEEDDPFDENYGSPIYRIYGVGADGLLDHISDCESYASARRLLAKLLPGIGFPVEMTTFSRSKTVRSGRLEPYGA
jgi:hypothetical protein